MTTPLERLRDDFLKAPWPKEAIDLSLADLNAALEGARIEERERIRRRLDDRHVDYWDALDADSG